MNRNNTLAVLFATAALLTGCGSGDDGDAGPAPPPPAPAPPDPLAAVPDAARQSIDGLVIYLKTLSLQLSDSREPASLDGVTLPDSDSAEPAPV
jgi:hypothetical protein